MALQNSVDFYAQACKALTQRSPFDSDESMQASTSGTSSNANVGSSTFLPGSWAQFLAKHLVSRSKHKKAHSGVDHKKRPEKSWRSIFWELVEDYFRELAVDDINKLRRHSSLGFSTSDKCFLIPSSSNVYISSGNSDRVGTECYLCRVDSLVNLENMVAVHGDSLSDTVLKEEGMAEKSEQEHMEVDIVGGVDEVSKEQNGDVARMGLTGKKAPTSSGLEWLLGFKNKIYLTTERPSKKRKLLGGDAGLDKILVARPAEGSDSLCHYCSMGDFVSVSNRLITCTSCGMAVHWICYGVQGDLDESWLCSWCKHNSDLQNLERPCLLCPKGGGALKPTQKRENDGHLVNYAHLFCCQWMPETYVENTRIMEPIMNVDGISDTRKKLICYLCKVKYGACVRCSHGACRTSFHPICAREAGHRMEIWGRLGCDEVELRAFCSKHSESHSHTSGQSAIAMLAPVSSESKHQPATSLWNELDNMKDGSGNGDKLAVHIGAADLNLRMAKLNNSVFHGEGLVDNKSNLEVQPECPDVQQPMGNCVAEKETVENENGPRTRNFFDVLKQLIVQGKIDLKDVAADFGVSVEALAPVLLDNNVAPDMVLKLVDWLRKHAHIGSLLKTAGVKFKSSVTQKCLACKGDTDAVVAAESVNGGLVPVKCVPPQRRPKNDMRILKNDEGLNTLDEDNDHMLIDGFRNCLLSQEGLCTKESSDGTEKVLARPLGAYQILFPPEILFKQNLSDATTCEDILASNSCEAEGEEIRDIAVCFSNNGHSSEAAKPESNVRPNLDVRISAFADTPSNQTPDLAKLEACNSFIHPLILHKLSGTDDGQEYDGDRKISHFGASSSSGVCCSQHNQCRSNVLLSKIYGSNREQLVKARNMGLLASSPSSEVEGELLFYQHKLLSNAGTRKRLIDHLISRVSENLQQEIDFARRKQWDTVLLSQYLHELREARKQGRKERRHKEAQAILAAATAAVAASSRNSSLRKDSFSESLPVEDNSSLRTSNRRASAHSHQSSRSKDTASRSAATGLSLDMQSGPFHLLSDPSLDHPRMCNICQRFETILNPILVCSNCKVAVHLDCYCNSRKSSGPWYCELCEEILLSRGSGATTSNSLEKPYFVAECGLCGGTAGAFRKSTDGQWIHAFCAEWVLESKITRGQVHPFEGLETLPRGGDLCSICGRRQGVCIKCNYGNCQSTFHPTCACSTGFYMNVRIIGGKLQHKAYCRKHSLEQRTKAEKHGVEEFNRLKQVRVELERLRLLCERIIKREKLKRELFLCSHHILSSKRDNAVLSAVSDHDLCHVDISSESVTTSTRGYTGRNKSGIDMVQRSDDLTVDSTVPGKRRVKILATIDSDQNTDDSSVSQNMAPKPAELGSFAGKHILNRPPVGLQSAMDDAERRSRCKKQAETFEKELIMTSDQASMKNQHLPKGFVYVPIECLAKEKD